MEKVDKGHALEIGDEVLYQPVEEELVLLNLKTQQYYGLDGMGSRIWHLLIEHGEVEAVVDCICAEYDAERSHVLRDIVAMAEDLCAAGLLMRKTGEPLGAG